MKYFAAKGHDMHLISYADVSAEKVSELEAAGLKYHGSTGNFYIKKPWLTFKDIRFVRSVLRSERIDILHSHFLGANAWYGAVSGFHPHIITIMGGGDVSGPGWKPNSNVQSKLLTPFSLRNADYITSWSGVMADAARPFCGKVPIEVVHGGIHLEKFVPGDKPEYLLKRWDIPHHSKVIFSPRLMRPLSNVIEIARAAHLVSEQVPNTLYLVAFPETAVDTEYSEEVRKTFGGNNVRFVSGIPHDEIADYFRLADVTVSIPDTDGTPMTVLESMACGRPTVIGDLPDYDREYFEHEKTTLMVDVKDPRAIADAVIRYLTDAELTQRVTAEARRRVVETGGYEFQMEKMEAIYHKVMER
jgi:glycosyltransferase involved in cell wall biosynthesis